MFSIHRLNSWQPLSTVKPATNCGYAFMIETDRGIAEWGIHE